MALSVWGALGLVALALAGPGDAPLAWSPDGEWVAYALAVRPIPNEGGPRWLFPPETSGGDAAGSAPSVAPRFRLWATRVGSGESVLLEESAGPLSAPCWAPDGKALAYARIVPDGPDRARYEVVVQEASDRQRVVLSRSAHGWDGAGAALGALAPAWSPDGRFLAVPLFQQTLDLGIVRADNGRLLKVLEDAYWPAWSPDGKGPLLAFVRGRQPQSLLCVDASFGAPRTLVELGETSQAPVWLDGNSLVAAAKVRPRKALGPQLELFQVVRVAVDTGLAEPLAPLRLDAADPEAAARGGSFSFDRDAENLFFSHVSAARAFEIVWNRPRHSEIHKRDNPFDFSIPAGALAVSPGDRYLGFRSGGAACEGLPAVMELADDRYQPTALVPDDDARIQWVMTLAGAARRLLLAGLPAPQIGGARSGAPKAEPDIERPTILPLPGEIPSNNDIAFRLGKLGHLGRPLCERPAESAPAEPGVRALLDEARLFFDYLRRDFDAALAALDALEARATDPDVRLRLLSVRAQIYLLQGRGEQARETIAYLRDHDRKGVERVEETPWGIDLKPLRDPRRGWPSYLSERAEAYLKAIRKPGVEDEEGHNPFGNRNPDAPDAAFFEAPIVPRRPPIFPFVPPGQVPRLEAAPDLVLPPGGVIVPPPAPAPPRPGVRKMRTR
jgi:hypothetical protein